AADVVHACGADHGQDLHHVRVGHPAVGSEVHPGGPFGSHEGGERGPEVLIGEGCLVDEDVALAVERDHEARFRLERLGFGAWQADVHTTLHDRSGDHEDDQQDEGDVHEGRDVDVRVQGQLAVPAQSAPTSHETGH